MRKFSAFVAATLLATVTPGAASAQEGGNATDTSYGNPQPQEERGFPWGLLGLLGLLGLIPRKKAPDVHIDNRGGANR